MLRRLSIAVILLALAQPASAPFPPARRPAFRVVGIEERIVLAAIDAGIEPGLALAVAWRESRFRPRARSPLNSNGTRDWGLFQLNDTTIRALGIADPFDVEVNIRAGTRLLAAWLAECGSVETALYAYAWGHCPSMKIDSGRPGQ